MVFSPNEILIIVLLAAPLFALVDVLRMPGDLWEASKQNQALWAVLVLLIWVLGAILYLIIARPRLVEARDATTPQSDQP